MEYDEKAQEEIIAQIEADDAERLQNAVELKRKMLDLKESEGFKTFVIEMQKQIERRSEALFAFPSGGLDTVVSNVYTSGEVAGLRMSIQFPDILLSFAQQDIDMQKIKDEREIERDANG